MRDNSSASDASDIARLRMNAGDNAEVGFLFGQQLNTARSHSEHPLNGKQRLAFHEVCLRFLVRFDWQALFRDGIGAMPFQSIAESGQAELRLHRRNPAHTDRRA